MIGADASQPTVMVLANGGKHVGWGHIMRCCSIARELEGNGAKVYFAVRNDDSVSLVRSMGYNAFLVETPSFASETAVSLVADIALLAGANAILVDSYDVGSVFFQGLHQMPLRIGYIDDLYLDAEGQLEKPKQFDVDLLINYGLSANVADYDIMYCGKQTRCLTGPRYVPVRQAFIHERSSVRKKVESILITTGSTNPNQALERMVLACRELPTNVEINVVIGKNSSLNLSSSVDSRLIKHAGVNDLSDLMRRADIALSSAGSTLYELACVGVPTIALPIVQNQLSNACGFIERGLGIASLSLDWSEKEVNEMLWSLIGDYSSRVEYSTRMRNTIDGKGASRIAEYLIDIAV